MYTLIIGNSKSPKFNRAIDVAKLMGGEYDGSKITITIKESMKVYEKLFPLFKLNVLNWKNTRAYYEGKKINPYRFALKMKQKRRTFYAQVLEELDDGHLLDYTEPFLYYKRKENTFYFQGINNSFSLEFKDKLLYDFVDKYDLGDIVYFE